MNPRSILIAGVLLWLTPFLISFALFPIRQAGSPLFETLIAVTLALCAVLAARWVFPQPVTPRRALLVGLLWLALSVLFDLPLFLAGPYAMPPQNYLADIALTYLMFPIITVGVGARWRADS